MMKYWRIIIQEQRLRASIKQQAQSRNNEPIFKSLQKVKSMDMDTHPLLWPGTTLCSCYDRSCDNVQKIWII